jgi:hypothetical protein
MVTLVIPWLEDGQGDEEKRWIPDSVFAVSYAVTSPSSL